MVTKHVQIMVRTTDYKSGDLYLKGYHIECTSPKIKCCPIDFDIDIINEDTSYIYSTPLISSNPTDKNTIVC